MAWRIDKKWAENVTTSLVGNCNRCWSFPLIWQMAWTRFSNVMFEQTQYNYILLLLFFFVFHAAMHELLGLFTLVCWTQLVQCISDDQVMLELFKHEQQRATLCSVNIHLHSKAHRPTAWSAASFQLNSTTSRYITECTCLQAITAVFRRYHELVRFIQFYKSSDNSAAEQDAVSFSYQRKMYVHASAGSTSMQ